MEGANAGNHKISANNNFELGFKIIKYGKSNNMKKTGPGTVKITSGELKRRSIKTPGDGTHPMGERERLALFNIISEKLPGATILDAYAGSGALGLEAISRGAKKACFIEKAKKAIEIIKENCLTLNIQEDKTSFFLGSVNKYYEKFKEEPRLKDIILADPPYDDLNMEEISLLTHFLKPSGIFVLSHPGASPIFSGLKLLKTQKYASAHLSIYKKLG